MYSPPWSYLEYPFPLRHSYFPLLSYPKHFLGYRVRIPTWVWRGGCSNQRNVRHVIFSMTYTASVFKQKEQRYWNTNRAALLPTGRHWKWQLSAGSWPQVHIAAVQLTDTPLPEHMERPQQRICLSEPWLANQNQKVPSSVTNIRNKLYMMKRRFCVLGKFIPRDQPCHRCADHLETLNFEKATSNISSSSTPVITESENPTVPRHIWDPQDWQGQPPHRVCIFTSEFALMLSAHKVGIIIPVLWEGTKAGKD